MKYVCLIYENESVRESNGDGMHQEYGVYTQEVAAAGKLLAGDALELSSTATTVRVREGETLTTDGPYAETKEQIGGYYVLDCDDLDDVLAWAAKIPGARRGAIEVRPIMNVG